MVHILDRPPAFSSFGDSTHKGPGQVPTCPQLWRRSASGLAAQPQRPACCSRPGGQQERARVPRRPGGARLHRLHPLLGQPAHMHEVQQSACRRAFSGRTPPPLCSPSGCRASFSCTDPANPQAQSAPRASARGRSRRPRARRRRTRQHTRRRPLARCRTPPCARGRRRPRSRRGASPRAARTRRRCCPPRAPRRASCAAREGAAAARCCARMRVVVHAAHAGLGALCSDGAE